MRVFPGAKAPSSTECAGSVGPALAHSLTGAAVDDGCAAEGCRELATAKAATSAKAVKLAKMRLK